MSNYETKKIKFLGETPTHIKEQDLLDYFLYTFEFVWTASAYAQHKKTIKEHYETLLNELKAKHENLTIGQQWWSLVLFALKDLAQSENYTFSMETIQSIVSRIHTLTDDELEEYGNSINHAYYNIMPDVLSIRPLEVQKLQSDAYENDSVLAYFLDKKEAFLDVFKGTLKAKEIDMMYINNLMLNDKKVNEKFTDLWNGYLEIFIGFSIAMFDLVLKSPKNTKEDIDETVRQTNLVFLISSVKNNAKIDELNIKLSELVRPLYKEYLLKEKE